MSYSENQLEQFMGGYGVKPEPKILYLTLKKKWFDMINHKDCTIRKYEEYRAVTDFWIKRLIDFKEPLSPLDYKEFCKYLINPKEAFETFADFMEFYGARFKDFNQALFANGGHFGDVPKSIHEVYGITIKEGKPEWGAEPGVKYFVITLGEIIK